MADVGPYQQDGQSTKGGRYQWKGSFGTCYLTEELSFFPMAYPHNRDQSNPTITLVLPISKAFSSPCISDCNSKAVGFGTFERSIILAHFSDKEACKQEYCLGE
jgi:hypothetical protein